MCDQYTIDLPPSSFDWDAPLARSKLDKLRILPGHKLRISPPLTDDDLRILRGEVKDHAAFDALYQALFSAQDSLIVAYPQERLNEWLIQVVCESDWFPLLGREAGAHAASALRGIFERALEARPDFADRLKLAVTVFVTDPKLELRHLGAGTLRAVLLLVGYFGVESAIPLLNSIVNDEYFETRDALGTNARVLAVRVFAGLADAKHVRVLRAKLEDARCAVACFEGLVERFPQFREESFWTAVTSLCRAGDTPGIYSLCDTLFSNCPEPIVPWVAERVREILSRTPSLSQRVVGPFLECLLARKGLVTVSRRSVAYPVKEVEPYADELHLSDPSNPKREAIVIQIPSELLAKLPSDLSAARSSPMLTMAQARRM